MDLDRFGERRPRARGKCQGGGDYQKPDTQGNHEVTLVPALAGSNHSASDPLLARPLRRFSL